MVFLRNKNYNYTKIVNIKIQIRMTAYLLLSVFAV